VQSTGTSVPEYNISVRCTYVFFGDDHATNISGALHLAIHQGYHEESGGDAEVGVGRCAFGVMRLALCV
jgi:hypothetical protein